jgi:hypothetical protein
MRAIRQLVTCIMLILSPILIFPQTQTTGRITGKVADAQGSCGDIHPGRGGKCTERQGNVKLERQHRWRDVFWNLYGQFRLYRYIQ